MQAESGTLTYAELVQRALGADPETLVALCFPRSIAFVVGAVGIVKSGGAYLPINPSTPSERVSAMLADSEARIVVTSKQAAKTLSNADLEIVTLDGAGNGKNFPEPLDEREFPADRLAYVIYTSGSTGEPKGVEVTHANLQHLLRWHHRAFSVTATDRATLFANPGFDASVWEMWPYLVKGSALYIPPDSIRASPAALRDWMIREKITIGFLPPL